MRDLKELLELLKHRIKIEWTHTGMCNSIRIMSEDKIITDEETNILRKLIRDNRPKETFASNGIAVFGGDLFWWKMGEKPPRINCIDEWLKEL